MSEAAAPSVEYVRIQVRPLGGALGAEVTGVDLAQAATDGSLFAEVHRAFLDNLVLVFPDQNITPTEQVAFTERFGEVIGHPLKSRRHLEEAPAVHALENFPGHRGGRNDWWHSDISFGEVPPMASLLYGLEVPEGYGDTMFCNMYAAWAQLSAGLREMLGDLSAMHSAETLAARNDGGENNEQGLSHLPPPVAHPVARTHPETGRIALYVNAYFTKRFADMSEAESKPLLEFLLAQATRSENVYRHRWRQRDVVMWDNRCSMHYGVLDYDETQRRIMHRTTAQGDRPR
jgi:taurine dioxygenase